MLTISRRGVLRSLSTLPLSTLLAKSKFRIGVTDWNLKLASNPEAVGLAARCGFEGVEVSLGRKAQDDKLPLASAELQDRYLAEAKRHKVALAGVCLDILHVNYLKNDKLGQKWVMDSIPIAAKLQADVILLPFFGKGAIEAPAEQEFVADFLKEAAPEAKKYKVTLGLENTISAEENARMLDRISSPAAKVYYDVGNSTGKGYDIIKELRWLGAERICQVHLKDNPAYLGEGKIEFPQVLKAIRDIDYKGFANLETVSPSGVVEADMKRNLTYIRRLLA